MKAIDADNVRVDVYTTNDYPSTYFDAIVLGKEYDHPAMFSFRVESHIISIPIISIRKLVYKNVYPTADVLKCMD